MARKQTSARATIIAACMAALLAPLAVTAAAADPEFTSRVDESDSKPTTYTFVLNADNPASKDFSCKYKATFDANTYEISGKVQVPAGHTGMVTEVPLKECKTCEPGALLIDCAK